MGRNVAAVPLLLTAAIALTACNSTGGIKVPFTKEKPFVATAVPADFAVVVDENHDTFYARQHIRQTIAADNAMSRTVYTTYRDYNNTISNDFSQETPLSPVQLQNMWNDVSRYNLMDGSSFWINWRSGADLYKRNAYTLQIRADGHTRTYTATNGFSGNLRPLMLQVEAVRLPISQNSSTPVIAPPTPPAAPTSPEAPMTRPATEPAAPVPAASATPSESPASTQPVSSGFSDGGAPIPAARPETPEQPAPPAESAVTPPPAAPSASPGSSPSEDGGYHQLKVPSR